MKDNISEDDISRFTEQANKYKVLAKDEEKILIALAQQDPPDMKAKTKLVKHNIRLVIKIAKRYLGQGLTFEDLIQEGLMGFLKGVEKFDLNKRVNGKALALSTYATWWIRQGITRAIDNTSRTIRSSYTQIRRVPELLRNNIGNLEQIMEEILLIKSLKKL